MSDEQVQVREGVWLTREGEEIEVRARDVTGIDTEWRWEGKRRGHYNTWRDDGTIHIEREQKEGDLVRFLRPLPDVEAEPTPEPVQVRPGIWKTREGHEVEVRERDDNGPAHFRWVGLLSGVRESWRDDGTRSLRDEADRRDLVEYVGPLPQQTTTDTLAEIEEQTCETLQEALGRALEQAYIADLKKAIDAATADRDRLQQAHQTMTEHARELLECGQQARESRDSLEQQLATMTYERDILAQRLATKPSEEALQKEVSRKQIEINTLQDKLEYMTADRDRLEAELKKEFEALQDQRFETQQAHAGCKRAEENLETVTAQALRLTAELRQAQIDLDAERETPAANCRAVVDAHLVGAQTGRQAAFEAVERWVEVLAGVDSEHAAAVLQALPGCIRKLAELEGVTW